MVPRVSFSKEKHPILRVQVKSQPLRFIFLDVFPISEGSTNLQYKNVTINKTFKNMATRFSRVRFFRFEYMENPILMTNQRQNTLTNYNRLKSSISLINSFLTEKCVYFSSS